jgi:hypothetical protein
MSTLSTLAPWIQDRLEEPRGAGIFWSTQYELYPFLADSMFEAMLATGEPQVRISTPYTLTPGSTLFPMPANALAILRIDGPGMIDKRSWWELDMMQPGWRNVAPAASILNWFPFGLTRFGIYPQVAADQEIFITVVSIPIQVGRPYTGSEPVDFQEEYFEGLVDSAAHLARYKEGGQELLGSLDQLDRALSKYEELSKFGLRKGQLRFTRTVGAPAKQQEPELQ